MVTRCRIFLATITCLATALTVGAVGGREAGEAQQNQQAQSVQSAQLAPLAPLAPLGRSAFIEMGCHHCHGYEGQGARPTGPRLAPEPMPLEVFSNIVRRPPNVMPAYSPEVLSDEKLKWVHEYLESIPEPPDVMSLPAFAEKP